MIAYADKNIAFAPEGSNFVAEDSLLHSASYKNENCYKKGFRSCSMCRKPFFQVGERSLTVSIIIA